MGAKKSITSKSGCIQEGVEFIRQALKDKNLRSKEITRTMLTAEEVLAKIIANAPDEETPITIEVGGLLGNVEIIFKAKGKQFDAAELEKDLLFEQEDEEYNAVLRKLVDKVIGNSISVKNSDGRNVVLLKVRKSYYAGLIYTILALLLGVLSGYMIQILLPSELGKGISANLFAPIYTIFMNALKMIVGPLVFFSVASSIADFGDLKALGKIAFKVVIMYVFTSAIAICIGYLAYQIFPIGNPALADAVSAEAAAATLAKGEGVNISIKDTIVGIVPTDVLTPFQRSDMLQIIFMAVVLGMAVSVVSRKYPDARKTVSALNEICSKITTVMVSFIPLVVFCSMAKMMISMNFSNLLSTILWVPVVYFGDVLMIIAYLILLLVLSGLNPVKFLAKYYPAMFSAFTFASSNAALPSSIKGCEDLGVSQRVYSFSLPLGATVNMDGSCISLIITSLFFAKIFGIPMTDSALFSLFVAIIVLTLGSPGVPGGNLVCIALLVPKIGVPAEAISLVMGLYPLVGMMQTCANVTGDAVVTTIVAKRNNMLDEEKYES